MQLNIKYKTYQYLETVMLLGLFTLEKASSHRWCRACLFIRRCCLPCLAIVPIGHRFKIHLFWTTKINDGPFISGSDFFSC